MKISTTKKAAILATVLSGFVLGNSAEAANKLGVVTASDYITSHMGALEGSFIHSDDISAVKSVIVGLNRDPAVYNTVDQVTGESSLYIRQYNYSTTNLQNSYAFSAQGNWDERAVGNTSGAVNAHDVARYNNYVYVASYDEGTVGIAQVTGDTILDMPTLTVNLKEDLKRYAKITYGDSAQFHGEGVVIIDGTLYVIANVNPYGGYKPYDGSYLMKYVIQKDGSLKYDGYTQMGKNTDSVALNVYNNYILTTAIGGYQNYGAEYSNEETTLNVATIHSEYNYLQGSRAINLPENLYTVRDGKTVLKSEFRSLKVMPNGTAYVMTYNIGRGGDNVDVTVYQTTVSNLLSNNPQNWKEVYKQEAAPGWFGRLDAEYNTKRLWVQVGNKLNIFTDGATAENGEMISLGTQDFTTSPLYNELYTWDIISTDIIPEGNLVSLKLSTGDAKANTNTNVWKDELGNVTNVERLVNVDYQNIESKDNLISITSTSVDENKNPIEGNLTNNILAGIYADGVKSTIIANNGIQVQVENNIASPVGVYAGNGGSVNIYNNGGNFNVLTKTLDSGNTLTNAIWVDPTLNGAKSSITIDAKATNITMEGGYGGNGVAIQKTDRWGENSKESTQGGKITINGNLNIKGTDEDGNADWGIGADPTNVLSRFNNAGILVDVENSSVEVTGNVDMDIYGNGVTVIGENSTVTITKGGSITVPTGTDYGYYALAAYDKGTINMNADGGNNSVKLDGDIFATSGSSINLGLATEDSYLNGIVDNGGTANVTLKNGATWTNVANNNRYYQDNEDVGTTDQRSHVTQLTGGATFDDAGTIIQKANSDNLYIETLSGAVKVKYDSYAVGEGNTVTVDGGNVTINEATVGSLVGLYAENKGIDTTDKAEVTAVLNALANKLYYNGYMQRTDALTGYVTIGEGMTSSSITNNTVHKIEFTTDGQGTTTGEGTGTNPDSGNEGGSGEGGVVEPPAEKPVLTDIAKLREGETVVTNANANTEWNPTDIQNTAITSTAMVMNTEQLRKVTGDIANVGNDILAGMKADGGGAGINALGYGYPPPSFKVQLQIESDSLMPVGIYVANGGTATWTMSLGEHTIITKVADDSTIRTNAVWLNPSQSKGGSITLGMPNNQFANMNGPVNITMLGGYGGNGIAITRDSNDVFDPEIGEKTNTIKIQGDLNIKGIDNQHWGIGPNKENFEARTNNAGIYVDVDKGTVEVAGTVDMDIYGNGVTVDGDEASVTLKKGGSIVVPKGTDYQYYALAAYDGSIKMNWANNTSADANSVKLDGDLYVGKNGTISIGMNKDDSFINGAIVNDGGTVNLFMGQGSEWTNVANNGDGGITSHITQFNANSNYSPVNIYQTAQSGDIVIDKFGGSVNVYYDHEEDDPANILGGFFVVRSCSSSSNIVLHTDNNGITNENVEATLGSLANKLYYLGYMGGEESNLSAQVQIEEGMTTSSITMPLTQEVKFNDTTGQGSLTGELSDGTGAWVDSTVSGEEDDGTGDLVDTGKYYKPITGNAEADSYFERNKVLQENGEYNFTKPVNTFTVSDHFINGGAWMGKVGTTISAGSADKQVVMNLNGNDLIVNNSALGACAGIAAIDGGSVVINNTGNIIINSNGHGQTAALYANSTGNIYIHNADGGVVTLRAVAGESESYADSGAVLKTMNGVKGRSEIVIDGMVDIVADRTKFSNEAISAVASTIEVGGGNIQAINGAWAAIRTYGEFVTENSGVVNVNVVKQVDENGEVKVDPNDVNVDLVAGAGNNKTTIIGDFVTNGGMGTKGAISVGLNGEDSYWIGNYGDARGYGVTQGMEGKVNLFMKNGATWTGFSDGEMNITMEGEGTTWYGFNLCYEQRFNGIYSEGSNARPYDYYAGAFNLNLKDNALWINAISPQQQNEDGKLLDSLVTNFVGDGGFIDMTGRKTFWAINDANHEAGSNGLSSQNTGIIEYGDKYETGNLVISNYSGDTTVIYRHDTTDVTNILGGTTTIKSASAGSNITLSTDSTGVDMTNTTQVTDVLDNLAEKLFYTAYTTGERNLSGKVQIAEGLTTSSAGKYFGEIEFDATNQGQGGLKDGSLTKPGNPPAGDDDQDDNTQGGGNEGGNQGTTPEQPEQKPVVEETFVGGVTADSLTDTSEDSANPYKDLITTDKEGNNVIDFGELDKDEAGNDKPASEIVDIVKIEAAETAENNIVISSNDATKPVIIDMAGKDLAVSGTTTGEDKEAKGISAINGAVVTISNAGNITIKANAENGSASAIHAQGTGADNKATVSIDNAETGGTVMLRAEGKGSEPVLNAGSHADVNITGKVDITNTNGNVAVSVGEGSTVAIGGGIIGDKAEEGKDSVAIHVNGGKVNINADGNETVVINGKIVLGQAPVMRAFKLSRNVVVPTDKSSLALTDKDSSLNDDVHYAGTGANDFAIAITDGATWTGNSTGGVNLDVILADGGAWTGYQEDLGSNTFKMQLSNGAQWTNTATDATIIDSLSGEGGSIQMSDDANADVTVTEYSGSTTFLYNNAYGEENAENLIKGGDVTIVAVDTTNAANANVTLRTHSIGTSDKDEVTKVLEALAKKLAYKDYGNAPDNLKGVVQILEGMTTSGAMRTGDIVFDADGNGSLKGGSVSTEYTGDYIYGDDETAMMRGAKSAMASTVMMWRSESADLLQRFGDLRMQEAEHGIWAKYYGGKYEMDAQNTNFTTSYTAYQLGYDKEVGNGWVVGAAVSHNDGDATYTMGGKGEATVTSLSVYGTKNYEDGRYLGLILKGGQLKNDFEVYNNDNYKLEGEYETFGTSLSAEYGKRIEKANGFYFDPSVELTIGRVQGKGYTATSDLLKAYGKEATMQVDQDDFNSMVGRIGFGIGQKLDKASYYAKLALAHEFAGDFDTTYTAEQTKGTSIDFGDTWYELQIGGTAKLNDNSLIYATYERSFGGDVTQKWRLDAGVRVTF